MNVFGARCASMFVVSIFVHLVQIDRARVEPAENFDFIRLTVDGGECASVFFFSSFASPLWHRNR